MFLEMSHVLGFIVLSVGSYYDIFHGRDVPDLPAMIGIVVGIALHGVYAWQISSMQPIYWCLGVGLAFSAYGWMAYWKGMWGGADAMMLSALGFMAPGPLSGGFGIFYVLDMITNFMIASLGLTLTYSVYKFVQNGGGSEKLVEAVLKYEKTLTAVLLGGGGLGMLLYSQGINGFVFFLMVAVFSFLYVFLKLVQEEYMVVEKDPEQVEIGDVAAPEEGFGNKIRGLKEKEVEEVSEPLRIRTGVPFIPVFLFTLLLTDLTASGVWILYFFY